MRHRFPLIVGCTVFAVAIMQIKKGESVDVGAEIDIVQAKAAETQKNIEDKLAVVQEQFIETPTEEIPVTTYSEGWFEQVSETMATNNDAVSKQTSLDMHAVAHGLSHKQQKSLLAKVLSRKTSLHEKKLAYYLLENCPSTPAKYLKKISKSHQMIANGTD